MWGKISGVVTAAVAAAVLTPGPVAAHEPAPARTTAAFAAELAQADDQYFDVLVVFRDRSGFGLLSALDRPIRYYDHFPVARVLLGANEIEDLLDEEQVRLVEPNAAELRLLNEEARTLTRVDELQTRTTAGVTGATGAGVHVAVIDSGVDATHPDLAPAIEESWMPLGTSGTVASPASTPATPNGTAYDGRPLPAGDHHTYVSATPDGIDVGGGYRAAPRLNSDLHGHGTHVSGVIAGQGEGPDRKDMGVAPGARLHVYQWGISPTTAYPLSFTLDAYDHLLRDARIRLVNASIGSGACDPADVTWPHRAVFTAMRSAFERGVLTILSYGNSGASDAGKCTATTLSVQPYALGVGATTKGRLPWTGSSRGIATGNHDRVEALRNLERYLETGGTTWPVDTAPIGLHRPGLVAPGAWIVSTVSAHHLAAQHLTDPWRRPGYAHMTGSSMSAPHVTGIAALVLEAYRNRHGADPSPLTLIGILEGSADGSLYTPAERHVVGAGLADAAAAVKRARAAAAPLASTQLPDAATPTTAATSAVSGSVAAGSYLTDVGYQVMPIVVPAGTRRLVVSPALTGVPTIGYSLFAPTADAERVRTGRAVTSNVDQLAQPTLYAVEVAEPEPGQWLLRVDGARTGGPFTATVSLLA